MTPDDPLRKPVFSFLWPVSPTSSSPPVQHQSRFVRLGGRGILRISALAVLAVTIVIGAGSVILAGFRTGISGWTIVAAAGLATACVVLFRGSVAGTYVNDDGIAVRCITRSVFMPWDSSEVGLDRDEVRVTCAGQVQRTHLRRRSPDWPLSTERYAIAVQAMRTWARAHHSWTEDFRSLS